MEDFNNIIQAIGQIGLPMVISAGVLYILWNVARLIPSSVQSYLEEARERDKKYNEQMSTIILVAQQGVEAQRRGNEIIERNNIIIESKSRYDEQLLRTLEGLTQQSCRTEETVKLNHDLITNTCMDLTRISEKICSFDLERR